jgi:hypothetical protein
MSQTFFEIESTNTTSSIPIFPSHHGSVWVVPVTSLLSTNNWIAGASLPNHIVGEIFVGPKKKTILVFNPLCFRVYISTNVEDSFFCSLENGVRIKNVGKDREL